MVYARQVCIATIPRINQTALTISCNEWTRFVYFFSSWSFFFLFFSLWFSTRKIAEQPLEPRVVTSFSLPADFTETFALVWLCVGNSRERTNELRGTRTRNTTTLY